MYVAASILFLVAVFLLFTGIITLVAAFRARKVPCTRGPLASTLPTSPPTSPSSTKELP